MKKILVMLLLILNWSCDETTADDCSENTICSDTEVITKAYLDEKKSEILELVVNSSTCTKSTACALIGLGSKPCGGPWEYIIYNSGSELASSIESLVETYNQEEEAYNIKNGVGSDCAVSSAPDSVKCEGGDCVGYSQGVAFTDGLCCN